MYRTRKAKFVKLFTKAPPQGICPHFYELILSNGCPFNCLYCYLKLTFRGQTKFIGFINPWMQIEAELNAVSEGVFSTGELADSLAIPAPHFDNAINYFRQQRDKFLLLTTKSANIQPLLVRKSNAQVIVSFSVNAPIIAKQYELGCPSPQRRLEAAYQLKELGWRVRIRLDPLILNGGISIYKDTAKAIAQLQPERVTVGSLRSYPQLPKYAPNTPVAGLHKSLDGRMRYPLPLRVEAYKQVADWLGYQPALCKETSECWQALGWQFYGCNCTK